MGTLQNTAATQFQIGHRAHNAVQDFSQNDNVQDSI